MKIQILKAARNDLLDGFDFYEAQQQGLGTYFLDALFADIDSLQLYAGIHPLIDRSYYRLLSKRFPFAIYCRMDPATVRVYAVLDCRRHPAWRRKRLGEAREE
jgi:hypothetical protein